MEILMHSIIKRIVTIVGITFSCLVWSEEAPKNPNVVTYGDWGMQCTEEAKLHICQAVQVLWLEQDKKKQRVLTLQLIPKDEEQKVLQLSFPLGVDLRPGIVIAVDDGSEQKFSYATCNNQSCFSLILMTEEQLSMFKKGNILKIGFRTFGSDKTVVLEASLKGFTKANVEVKKTLIKEPSIM
jgi:invasion protein IalB